MVTGKNKTATRDTGENRFALRTVAHILMTSTDRRQATCTTNLVYTKDDGTRPHTFLRPRTAAEQSIPENGGSLVPVAVKIFNARDQGMTLDKQGFQLVKQYTRLSTEDFYTRPDLIKSRYYAEMAETIKRYTGAAHVQVVHHQVRNKAKQTGRAGDGSAVQGYAPVIHTDSHPRQAEDMFRRLAFAPGTKRFRKGRFMYINAWRNISDTPIANDHLAVCDETSVVKPDDYIVCDIYNHEGKSQQYRLCDRNSMQHRWYYYPGMTKSEVLLFKQWDSDTTRRARICFHSAFSDPAAPRGHPPRQSIEVRAIAYFPTHTPNTCPIVEVDGSSTMGDDQLRQAVNRILVAVDHIEMWPPAAVTWARRLSALGNGGIELIAKTIAEDKENHHGLRNASAEQRARVVALLLREGFAQRLRAKLATVP